MKEPEKFLQFNGRPIYFLTANGVCWIAIKPLCEVLEVNYNPAVSELERRRNFKPCVAKQQMHDASGKASGNDMSAEKFVYGWLFSLRSDSPPVTRIQAKML